MKLYQQHFYPQNTDRSELTVKGPLLSQLANTNLASLVRPDKCASTGSALLTIKLDVFELGEHPPYVNDADTRTRLLRFDRRQIAQGPSSRKVGDADVYFE